MAIKYLKKSPKTSSTDDTKTTEIVKDLLKDIENNNHVTKEIKDTSGGITFSLDDKYFFYSKLDENHRARKIYRHEIGITKIKILLIFVKNYLRLIS